ncbi:hypothetical protein ABVT39_014378, partial [Epinephelus coioides]
ESCWVKSIIGRDHLNELDSFTHCLDHQLLYEDLFQLRAQTSKVIIVKSVDVFTEQISDVRVDLAPTRR